QPTRRPSVAFLRDIDCRFLPANRVQNSQVCEAVLIRDISDAASIRRPARMKMIPVAKRHLVGFTAGRRKHEEIIELTPQVGTVNDPSSIWRPVWASAVE